MASSVPELIGVLQARPVFDIILAGQILALKNQIHQEHVLAVYDVAKQKRGLNNTVVNLCLSHYARHGNAGEAQSMIDRAVQDGVEHHTSWYTNLASAYAVDKNFKQALSTLNTMKGMKGRVFVPYFPTLIKTLGASRDGLAWCMSEFFRIVKTHVEVPTHVYGALISQFGKAGDIQVCIRLFDEMKSKNIEVNEVIYSVVIDAYARNGDMGTAEEIFHEMKRKGLKPVEVTYNTLIKGWGKLGNISKCVSLVEEMEREGVEKTGFTYGILMDAYRREGNVERCAEIFRDMEEKGVKPNVVTYTTLISAYSRAGNVAECEKLYNEMQVKGIQPSDVTYNAMLHVFELADKQKGINNNLKNDIKFAQKSVFVSFLLPFIQ